MSKKIMVVDDSEDIVELIKVILEYEKFEVIPAYSGIECLDILENNIPDLILLDIMMNPIDGWETLRRIKKNENFKNIPVSMLTVNKITQDILQSEEIEKIDNYIQKPFQKKDLIQNVKEILVNKEKITNTVELLKASSNIEKAKEYERLSNRINRHNFLKSAIEKMVTKEKNDSKNIEMMIFQEEKIIDILNRKLIEMEKEIYCEENNESCEENIKESCLNAY